MTVIAGLDPPAGRSPSAGEGPAILGPRTRSEMDALVQRRPLQYSNW